MKSLEQQQKSLVRLGFDDDADKTQQWRQAFHASKGRDRVTDNIAQFKLRWHDYARANSPRQRRLKAQRLVSRESRNELISAAGGILLLVAIILCLFYI